jgi:hypothetical protein
MTETSATLDSPPRRSKAPSGPATAETVRVQVAMPCLPTAWRSQPVSSGGGKQARMRRATPNQQVQGLLQCRWQRTGVAHHSIKGSASILEALLRINRHVPTGPVVAAELLRSLSFGSMIEIDRSAYRLSRTGSDVEIRGHAGARRQARSSRRVRRGRRGGCADKFNYSGQIAHNSRNVADVGGRIFRKFPQLRGIAIRP